MFPTLTQAEMTKHFRKRLRHENIPARVRMFGASIQVITPTYEFRWTPEQARIIGRIAHGCHLTFVRGLSFTEDFCASCASRNQFEFYMPVPA
jgi:hypothetical protein